MRRFTAKPSDVDEIDRRVNSSLAPLFRDLPGFASFEVIDEGPGRAVTLSTFAGRAAAEAGSKLLMNWMKESLADILPQQTATIMGEIKLRISSETPVAK